MSCMPYLPLPLPLQVFLNVFEYYMFWSAFFVLRGASSGAGSRQVCIWIACTACTACPAITSCTACTACAPTLPWGSARCSSVHACARHQHAVLCARGLPYYHGMCNVQPSAPHAPRMHLECMQAQAAVGRTGSSEWGLGGALGVGQWGRTAITDIRRMGTTLMSGAHCLQWLAGCS